MSPRRATPKLSQRIRDRRIEKNIRLRELARRLGIAPSYLSDIENERRIPAEGVLRGIAKELDLPFDELMGQAGRLGEQTERFLRQQPKAATLFRRIRGLGEDELRQLLEEAERLQKKSGS